MFNVNNKELQQYLSKIAGFNPITVDVIKNTFNKYDIEYMFIGQGSAILQGYDGTTQDVDVYPEKNIENNKKIVLALKEIGFDIDTIKEAEILKGKDFISFLEPFELDLVFAPDGFNNYEEAKVYKTTVEDYPVMNLEGIIKSKASANRQKDKATLDRLRSFKEYTDENR